MAVDCIEPGAQTGVVLAVLWSAVTILTQQFYLWVCFVNKVPWDGECTRNLDPWLKQGHASCNFPRFGFPTPLSCPVNTAGHRWEKDRTGAQPRGLSHYSVVDLRVALCPREHNSKWQTLKGGKTMEERKMPFSLCFLNKGLCLFTLHWAVQILSMRWLWSCLPETAVLLPDLPAQSLQLWTATMIGAGPVLLLRASHHLQGKGVTQFSLPRNDRKLRIVRSLEWRADLFYRTGTLSGQKRGKSCSPEIPLDADFPACWFPLQCGIRVKVPMWYFEKSNHDNSQVHRDSSRMY